MSEQNISTVALVIVLQIDMFDKCLIAFARVLKLNVMASDKRHCGFKHETGVLLMNVK